MQDSVGVARSPKWVEDFVDVYWEEKKQDGWMDGWVEKAKRLNGLEVECLWGGIRTISMSPTMRLVTAHANDGLA